MNIKDQLGKLINDIDDISFKFDPVNAPITDKILQLILECIKDIHNSLEPVEGQVTYQCMHCQGSGKLNIGVGYDTCVCGHCNGIGKVKP